MREFINTTCSLYSMVNHSMEFHKARLRVRKRDYDRCVVCQIYDPFLQFSTHSSIHHIDENRKNNRLSNLVTLCQWHHKRIHTLIRGVPLAGFEESVKLSNIVHKMNRLIKER